MKINTSMDIACSPETLFSWIDDPEKAMLWQTGVTKAEIILETPQRTGTRFREVLSDEGGQLEMDGVITGYEPGRTLSMHLESRVHTVDVLHSVEAIPTGARYTQDACIRWKFPVSILIALQGGQLKKKILAQSRREMARLKHLCEGTAVKEGQ